MFNKYIKDAAQIYAESNEKLGERLVDISQAEIKAKDRVNITLSEYLGLREELTKKSERLKRIEAVIMRMGIPYEVIEHIEPGSIYVTTAEDNCNFKKKYRVEFTVDIFKR